jgi:nucleoid-associated protein YgaU
MTRVWMVLLGATGMILTGCQKNEEPAAYSSEPVSPAYQSPYASTDTTSDTADTSLDELDSTSSTGYETTYEPADTSTPAYTSDEPLTPTAGRVYTVRQGDTLYKLARQFYNDQSRWRDIWEANRTRLPDPNKLSIGTRLIIP